MGAVEYAAILAQLELSEEEKEAAEKDLRRMLDYVDKLNELDTDGTEPLCHIFPLCNVFREDVVENGDDRDALMEGAPQSKDGMFQVPRTVE